MTSLMTDLSDFWSHLRSLYKKFWLRYYLLRKLGSSCPIYYCLGTEDAAIVYDQKWPACNGRIDCDNKRDEQDCKLFEPERQVIASTTLVVGKETYVCQGLLLLPSCSTVKSIFDIEGGWPWMTQWRKEAISYCSIPQNLLQKPLSQSASQNFSTSRMHIGIGKCNSNHFFMLC